jgi:tetratricopeptide (TPR) repeat protein
MIHGQVAQALGLLKKAEDLGAPESYPWFKGNIRCWQLYLALVGDGSLTESQLAAADADLPYWRHRRELAQLRYDLLVRQGQFERALTAAQERERLERNAGLETAPAESAFLLAKLARRDEASAAVRQSLVRLPRMHFAARPHYALALALYELGRHSEAELHACQAYQQAWRDGPPYCHHWKLRDARELLDRMGVPTPNLSTADPTTVKVPLEDEIRAFITKLDAERRDNAR